MARSERDPVFLTREGFVRRGVKRAVPVLNPAAGTEWSMSVPGGHQWRLITARSLFTTSAAVANRLVGVRIQDQDATVWQTQFTTAQVASQVNAVQQDSFGTPGPGASDNAQWTMHIPGLWLPPGWSFGSTTNGIQAGDQYSGIRVWVEDVFYDDSLLSTRFYNVEDAAYAAITHGG